MVSIKHVFLQIISVDVFQRFLALTYLLVHMGVQHAMGVLEEENAYLFTHVKVTIVAPNLIKIMKAIVFADAVWTKLV